MSECNWDPSKHGGKPCPVHGAGGSSNNGGHKIRINGGKYQTKLSDDSDWEEISPEEYNDLREGGYQDFDETVDDDFGFDEDDNYYHPSYEEGDRVNVNGTEGIIASVNPQGGYLVVDVNGKEIGEFDEEDFDEMNPTDSPTYTATDVHRLMKMAEKDGHKLSEEEAKNLLYQSYNPRYSLEDFYRELDWDADDNKSADEESSPMNEFSGPDREGPSYAQLDAMKTDKNGNKYLEFDSEKEAKEYFNNNNLPDGTVMYGNKIYMGKTGEKPQTGASEWNEKDYPGATQYATEIDGKKLIINKNKEDGKFYTYLNGKDVNSYTGFDSLDEAKSHLMNKISQKGEKPLTEEESKKLSSAEDKYNAYKEKGKSTWNQKLSRGDKITFKDRDGNEIEGFINGFYYKGELQDNDTYEEGKDNMWHDFRGINIVDTTGKDIGNINANQILSHERPKSERESNQLFKIRENMDPNDKKIAEYMNNLDEDQLYWLYDALRSKFGK